MDSKQPNLVISILERLNTVIQKNSHISDLSKVDDRLYIKTKISQYQDINVKLCTQVKAPKQIDPISDHIENKICCIRVINEINLVTSRFKKAKTKTYEIFIASLGFYLVHGNSG